MQPRRRFTFRFRGGVLVLGERTVIMGVINVTPDSFSDGGAFIDPAAAVEAGVQMVAAWRRHPRRRRRIDAPRRVAR